MAQDQVDVVFGANTAGLDAGAKQAVKNIEDVSKASKEAASSTEASTKRAGAAWVSLKYAFSNVGGIFKSFGEGARAGLGDATKDAAEKAGESLKDVASKGDLIGDAFSGLPPVFARVAYAAGPLGLALAAVGAAAFFAKRAADATAAYTEEAMSLGRAMGISATQSSFWMTTLEDVGATTSELQAATSGLSRKLREGEDDLKRMGVVTRDANGAILDMDTLMRNALGAVNSYKEGTDRNMASQEIFGRAVSGNSKLLLVNAEALQENEEYVRSLGGQVSGEALAAWEAYDSAMDKLGIAMTALRNTIGNAVMPVIAKLAEWLGQTMPAVIVVVRGALGGLMTAFWALKNGVVIVWETINAMVVSVAEPIRALSAAISKAMYGDWQGAKDEISGISKTISAAWSTAMGEMEKSSEETSQRIRDLHFQTDAPAPNTDGAAYVPKPEKEKKEKEEKSRIPEYEYKLEKAKLAAAQEDALREYSKSQELAYWQTIHDAADTTGRDREKVALRVTRLEIEIAREAARNQLAIAHISAEDARSMEMARIEELRANAQSQKQIGLINQQELIELERNYAIESYQIQLAHLQAKQALAELDPDKNVVLLAQINAQKLELQRQHLAELGQLTLKAAEDTAQPIQNIWNSVGQGLTSIANTMMTNWRNVGSALKGVMLSIGQTIVQETIVKPLQAKLASWAKERALAIAGIGANSAEGATGAMKAMSSIPYIGPALGLAAMAATFAAGMGMSSKVPSAAGGFDIPSGLNPMTQLHEKEMVLPAKHADVIRQMADGGGNDSQAPVNLNITALDARSIRQLFLDNGPAMADAIRQYARNGGST